MPLQIVADENIPLVREAFASFGPVTTLAGSAITNETLRTADVLLVRSVTKVDAALLAGTPVRFVGSATIGTDHVDEAALGEKGVAFAHAPGSNAESVVEWVLAALLHTATARGEALEGKTVGIVGAGNVGGRLAPRLEAIGCRVLVCDPPRARSEGEAGFTPLPALLAEADVVTLHTPLTHTGEDATYHLLGPSELAALKPGAWLLNASRGAVIDGAALLNALSSGHPATALLDVFEGEPTPNPDLLAACTLITPHIAGYSYDGKINGTLMLLDALEAWSGLTATFDRLGATALPPEDRIALTPPDPNLPLTPFLHALTAQLYPIAEDDARFREVLALPIEEHAGYFGKLRKTYPRRRAFGHYSMALHRVPSGYETAVGLGLGLTLR